MERTDRILPVEKVLYSLLAISFLLTVTVRAQKTIIPEGWHGVRACGFTFIVPNDLIQREVQPIDMCVAEFVGKNLAVRIDYGMYSGGPNKPSEDDRNYKTSTMKVGGQLAELATYYNDWENPVSKAPDKIWYADVYLTRSMIIDNKTIILALSFSVSRYESADPEDIKTIYKSLTYSGR